MNEDILMNEVDYTDSFADAVSGECWKDAWFETKKFFVLIFL